MQSEHNVIIISDILGFKNEKAKDDSYLSKTAIYFEKLGFITTTYSSLKLAKINPKHDLNHIHDLFMSDGFKNSILALSHNKKKFDIGIGFSIGGTILWKAFQEKKLPIKRLICLSSTRLRKEVNKITIPVITVFGELDKYAPDLKKIEKLNATYMLIPNSDHEFYKKTEEMYKIFQDCLQIFSLNNSYFP